MYIYFSKIDCINSIKNTPRYIMRVFYIFGSNTVILKDLYLLDCVLFDLGERYCEHTFFE
jgi:hypothetical protein